MYTRIPLSSSHPAKSILVLLILKCSVQCSVYLGYPSFFCVAVLVFSIMESAMWYYFFASIFSVLVFSALKKLDDRVKNLELHSDYYNRKTPEETIFKNDKE